MLTRTIDNHGRILIPRDNCIYFSDGCAYFSYSAEKKEVYAATISVFQNIQSKLEQQYGLNGVVNAELRPRGRLICASSVASGINSNGRVVIPEKIRILAEVDCGDVLEMRLENKKGFVLRKTN